MVYQKGLSVKPKKTTLVPFTRRRNFSKDEITMDKVVVPLSNHTKYLGVIFDQKLTWSLHVGSTVNKARNALFTCSKMVGRTWGLKPKMTDWMYKSIVRPIVSYAAFIWWSKTDWAINFGQTTKISMPSHNWSITILSNSSHASHPGPAST